MQIRMGKTTRSSQACWLRAGGSGRDAVRRLRWMNHYPHHGRNAAFSRRHFGIGRQCFYSRSSSVFRIKTDFFPRLSYASGCPRRFLDPPKGIAVVIGKRLREFPEAKHFSRRQIEGRTGLLPGHISRVGHVTSFLPSGPSRK